MTDEKGPSKAPGVESVKAEIVAAVPSLRAFAVSLCGNPDHAEDLVQDTLQKALGDMDSLSEGTNLTAWLFTILRNVYFSDYRKHRGKIADPDGPLGPGLPGFREALQRLPVDQRKALTLFGASGLSYEEAAKICGCAPSTMMSRVSRARKRMSELLGLEQSPRIEAEAPPNARIQEKMGRGGGR